MAKTETQGDITDWLRGLGLEQYAQAFHDNAIDHEILRDLTADDLIDLGVRLVGHRRKLLAAIAALRDHPPISTAANVPAQPVQAGGADIALSIAERRQLTVMFCDLVGSTALSARLDPEDLRDVLDVYKSTVAETVAAFGGFVARYLGDGVLVYFGYPRAQEDDAERAVRAGLVATERIAGLDTPAGRLASRVGIATGVVVVGDLTGTGAAQEREVVGDTPNIAARLQALAEPNGVVIAAGTRRLVGDLFEYRDLGPVELKGIEGTPRVWQVLRPSVVASRFEALRSTESPLVGRTDELNLLSNAWHEAITGAGRVVLISGEPGVGKSRLAEAFRRSLEREPHMRMRYFCSPHHQDSALFPIVGQLERSAGFERDDAPKARWEKLETLLAATHTNAPDVALLADLLSLPASSGYPLPDLTPQRKKERVFAALLRQFEALAQRQPVLMIFEDIHWADPTTRELLDAAIARAAHVPVLLLATFRPEFQSPWTGQAHVASVSPRRLDPSESRALVRRIAGSAALSDALVTDIVERTDGVPLFVEELTKAVLESNLAGGGHGRNTVAAVPAASQAVPATLHASLIARLERLGPIAKDVAQVGAAIGRDFSHQVLAATVQHSPSELNDALGRLVEAGLVFQRGALPDATFLFKHALVQDTAYGLLLRGPRRALHARIARALEQRFPDVAQTQPHVLARHFTEAGLVENALAYWLRAGQLGIAKSALVEAVAQLRRGLRLAAELPDASLRSQRQLDFQIALAGALVAMKGYPHPEVVEAFERARELVLATNGIGTIAHFSVLYGLAAANYHAGRPSIALDQVKEFLSLAEAQKDSGPLLQGHRLIGFVQLAIGDYRAAFAHAERAVTLYVPEQHRMLAQQFSADIGVQALCLWARALWHCGYPEQARAAGERALHEARQSSHHQTLAYALVYLGLMAVCARRESEVEALAAEAVVVAGEHGFPLFSGFGLIFQGWAMARRDPGPAAIAQIRQGLAATEAIGARNYQPIFLSLLAEALALTGETDHALTVLGEALAAAESSGAHGHVAEIHRLRGDLLWRRAMLVPDDVEVCFRTAVDIAREQGTRGYELRAATSLALLLRDQGKPGDAWDLLAPVYGWFTEAFDTADLNEAKLLLDELAPPTGRVRAPHGAQR
jgi:class 3 adenylate cyclase/predicted ATPase